tara:strand:+ start:70 stop:345 length:276 start_codon:yes stop_codon:yes gene_type:complete
MLNIKKIKIFLSHASLLAAPIFFLSFVVASEINLTCKNLEISLEVNSGAYKNCLLQKVGEEYTRKELEDCKKYYMQEMERLSYIYKNICFK